MARRHKKLPSIHFRYDPKRDSVQHATNGSRDHKPPISGTELGLPPVIVYRYGWVWCLSRSFSSRTLLWELGRGPVRTQLVIMLIVLGS